MRHWYLDEIASKPLANHSYILRRAPQTPDAVSPRPLAPDAVPAHAPATPDAIPPGLDEAAPALLVGAEDGDGFPDGGVVRDFLLLLVVDEDEGDEHDAGADPVQGARVLLVQDHLADEGEGDGEAEADGDDQRGGQ